MAGALKWHKHMLHMVYKLIYIYLSSPSLSLSPPLSLAAHATRQVTSEASNQQQPPTLPPLRTLLQLLIEIRLSLIALNGGATEMWVTSHVVVVVLLLLG